MDGGAESRGSRAGRWVALRPYVVLSVIYVLATLTTGPTTMGDTPVYVSAVARKLGGGDARYWDAGGFESFWEFGHLLWRPAGWLCYVIARPALNLFHIQDERAGVTTVFVAINWVAGLASVLLVYALARRACRRELGACAAALALLFSNAFLNYAQTGCSYVPGLALLLAGAYLLVRGGERPAESRRAAWLGGAALAGSICMWVPYMWAGPAALVAPLLLFGFTRARLRFSVEAAVSCALVTAIAYCAVLAYLGLLTPSDARAWIAASSHGVTHNRGVVRVLFGVPRSLVNVGTDSVHFKRYLARDPFNPVSLTDLFRASLWKMAFAYLFLGALALGLTWTKRGRAALSLLALAALPILAFALLFAGGVLERYLPLFPFVFLAVACCLSAEGGRRAPAWTRGIVVLFVAVTSVVNVSALSNIARAAEQEREAARVREVLPALKPGSRLIVAPQDQLWGFAGTYPDNAVNRAGKLLVDPVAILGTEDVARWREETARNILKVWGAGGDVWFSRRLLAERPRAEWNWAEREDPRIGWAEMHDFFRQFDAGETLGGEDGFAQLPPTTKNEQLLRGLAERTTQQGAHD